ncbi:MAG: hypothetical protein H0T54_05705 [Geodermatophilaceae bacterium]|nr:hypothetical protein [Geodermatophilaceae bacterium]
MVAFASRHRRERRSDCSVAFIASRASRALSERLERALRGRGAFRRFEDILFDWPEDREDWFLLTETKQPEWLDCLTARPERSTFQHHCSAVTDVPSTLPGEGHDA